MFQTVVQVHSGDPVQIVLTQLEGIPSGLMSYPISLELDVYTPYNGITLNLYSEDPRITVQPYQIDFSYENKMLSFEIYPNGDIGVEKFDAVQVKYLSVPEHSVLSLDTPNMRELIDDVLRWLITD